MNPTSKPLLAIAGASGFVGTRLREGLADSVDWLALTRSPARGAKAETSGHTRWRHCDLFSLPQVEAALAGASGGIYLVHSMLPSSRMVQGNFADMDLLLADNFARAAKAAGLSHIIYLGGLIPRDRAQLSPHLRSRLEVESVLRQSGLPVTVLRAGLIVGPGGSSTQMLINLVHRLPFMILPKWTRSLTQSIDVRDVVRAIRIVLEETELQGGTYDVAGHPAMSYRDMIVRTGRALGRRPLQLHYPFHSIKLSRLWVRCVSGVSSQLVNPLLESLTHDLAAQPNPLLQRIQEAAVPFERSVLDAIGGAGRLVDNPRSGSLRTDRSLILSSKRVRSVQRLPLPAGWDAPKVAEAYGSWLARNYHGIIRVEQDAEGALSFLLARTGLCLLTLTPTPHSKSGGLRRAFYISGGRLAQTVVPPGRFEFRLVPELNCLIAAIHGFAPSLPWWLYTLTQARIHLWVMHSFGRFLAAQGK